MKTVTFDFFEPLAPPLHPLRHLVRGVWLQALRRNELYVVAILMGLYVLGALALRIMGIESPQTARFITGLGLQLGALLAALLVILMGARQMPTEIELRTIYPVLAKPVTRPQLLLGKALPTWASGVAALFVFTAATLAITPRLPCQHPGVLIQALILKSGALAVLAAAVCWLSLRLPLGVSILASGAVYFFGGSGANMLVQANPGSPLIKWLSGVIPDFSLLDQFERYVNGGGALPAASMAVLALFVIVWTAIFSGLAAARFRRMML